MSDVLERVGVPIAPEAAQYPENADSGSIGLEGLAQIDPAVMFVMTDAKTTVADWEGSGLWQNLAAVKSGDVYEVNRALWTRSKGLVSMELIAQEATGLLYGGNPESGGPAN